MPLVTGQNNNTDGCDTNTCHKFLVSFSQSVLINRTVEKNKTCFDTKHLLEKFKSALVITNVFLIHSLIV